MSVGTELFPIGGAIGVACAGTLWLVARACLLARAVVLPATKTPLAIHRMLPFAIMTAPVIQRLLPRIQAKRIHQQLLAMDMVPQVDHAAWLALRLLHSVLFGTVFYFLASAMHVANTAVASLIGLGVGAIYADSWLQRSLRERNDLITRELPQYLDLLTVCVEAGATLTAGVRMIVERAPASPLRSYFETVLREVRAGRPRAQAFVEVARQYGVECLSALASALAHAESSGMSLGNVLRGQAEQRSVERFARAEKLAMQAPVKMLGPLICCIFPCTFIVLAVPIVYRLMEALGK
jgi:tight adherence protein C